MILRYSRFNPSHTRLIWRMRDAPYQWTSPYVVPQLFSDLADLIAVRQNILGIQARAEGVGLPSPVGVYTELALWLVAFLSFLVAEAGLVVRRDWLRPGLAVAATDLITIGLLLVKPPIWVDGLVALGSLVGVWWVYRPATQKALPGRGSMQMGSRNERRR